VVQVDTLDHNCLESAWFQRLEMIYDALLSNVSFNAFKPLQPLSNRVRYLAILLSYSSLDFHLAPLHMGST
jgi:hypothetical protein